MPALAPMKQPQPRPRPDTIGTPGTPFFLYPQTSSGIRNRQTPMPSSNQPNLNAEAVSAEDEVYNRLTPDQRSSLLPATGGNASLTISGPGGDRKDYSDNQEGIQHQAFRDQFGAALAAGKGDEFAAKYTPTTPGTVGGIENSPPGYQARYDTLNKKKAQTATAARQSMTPLPQYEAQQAALDLEKNPPEKPAVTAARIAATSREKVAQTAANAKKPTVLDYINGVGKLAGNFLGGFVDKVQKKAAADEVARHHAEMEKIAKQNADTAASRGTLDRGTPTEQYQYQHDLREWNAGLQAKLKMTSLPDQATAEYKKEHPAPVPAWVTRAQTAGPPATTRATSSEVPRNEPPPNGFGSGGGQVQTQPASAPASRPSIGPDGKLIVPPATGVPFTQGQAQPEHTAINDAGHRIRWNRQAGQWEPM